jgi:hypothetical protein
MNNTLSINLRSKETVRSVIFDVTALLFIFFVPALSHMLSVPVYFIEPMRLVLILMLLHTTKRNAYIIALTLPVFSFLVSAHPVLPIMMLMTAELVLNVFLFYLFVNKFKSVPGAILSSIIGSKAFYYLVQFGLLNTAIISSGLADIPIYVQIIMAFVFTGYAFVTLKLRKNKK